MKYKIIQVKGCPRAGNHYLAALIDINFFNGNDYIKHVLLPAGGLKFFHRFGGPDLKSNDVFIIYIWRDFDHVARSIFKLRERFGLAENNYKRFLERKLSDMWSDDVPCNVLVNTIYNKKIVTEVDTLFGKIELDVFSYWKKHQLSWFNLGLENIMYVNYNYLINNAGAVLKEISCRSGIEKKHGFKNVTERVGWMECDK